MYKECEDSKTFQRKNINETLMPKLIRHHNRNRLQTTS